VIGGYAAVLAGIDIVTRDIDVSANLGPADLADPAGPLACVSGLRLETGVHRLHAEREQRPAADPCEVERSSTV
jgi:hypothetical protein